MTLHARRPRKGGDPAIATHRACTRSWGIGFLAALVLLAGCTALKRCAYEGFGRDGWQQPDKVVQSLAITPGERIADWPKALEPKSDTYTGEPYLGPWG